MTIEVGNKRRAIEHVTLPGSLEMLRQHNTFKNVPVVALTASVMNEEIHRLKEVGFNGVIAKPVDMDTFPDVVNRLLSGEEIWRITT